MVKAKVKISFELHFQMATLVSNLLNLDYPKIPKKF